MKQAQMPPMPVSNGLVGLYAAKRGREETRACRTRVVVRGGLCVSVTPVPAGHPAGED
jgi:hypothetical protein